MTCDCEVELEVRSASQSMVTSPLFSLSHLSFSFSLAFFSFCLGLFPTPCNSTIHCGSVFQCVGVQLGG